MASEAPPSALGLPVSHHVASSSPVRTTAPPSSTRPIATPPVSPIRRGSFNGAPSSPSIAHGRSPFGTPRSRRASPDFASDDVFDVDYIRDEFARGDKDAKRPLLSRSPALGDSSCASQLGALHGVEGDAERAERVRRYAEHQRRLREERDPSHCRTFRLIRSYASFDNAVGYIYESGAESTASEFQLPVFNYAFSEKFRMVNSLTNVEGEIVVTYKLRPPRANPLVAPDGPSMSTLTVNSVDACTAIVLDDPVTDRFSFDELRVRFNLPATERLVSRERCCPVVLNSETFEAIHEHVVGNITRSTARDVGMGVLALFGALTLMIIPYLLIERLVVTPRWQVEDLSTILQRRPTGKRSAGCCSGGHGEQCVSSYQRVSLPLDSVIGDIAVDLIHFERLTGHLDARYGAV